MEQMTKIASDLNEQTDNRYKLVYEIAELAKKLVDESNVKKHHEDFGYEVEPTYNASIKKDKPVQHAIMVKASESDDSGLVG
ncbi:MAG: hypothetical protein ACD_20C00330G0002 [uncultured bacterium]|nr:MAG: hypothetical protein ACD_20C00330G0002 [uncultured bacterium]